MTLHLRYAADRLRRLQGTFPVVAITGARQVGKTTLAQQFIESTDGDYLTLDDPAVLSSALSDPDLLLAAREGLTVIDEVQRAPDLMRAVKLAVDRDRRPGRFILTGSANLLRMRSVTESLAGRAAYLDLAPLAWGEALDRPAPATVDRLMTCSAAEFVSAMAAPISHHVRAAQERAVRGGMPAVELLDTAARRDWYDGYQAGFVERDLRQISAIEDLPGFLRVFKLAMLRTGQLLNRSDLAADAGMPVKTVSRYLDVMGVGYQVVEAPAFFANVHKRLRKTPKLYANDVGMAAHSMAIGSWEGAVAQAREGALFESWVVGEVRALANLSESRPGLFHWRTSSGTEVDLVLETAQRVSAIEVKAGTNISARDWRGLKVLRDDLGERFGIGVVAYMGETSLTLADKICAVPVASLLGATRE